MLALALLSAIALTGARAHADAIGPCPPGQRVVMNPTTPGSGHHGGFHCEPDAPPEPTPPPSEPAPATAPATAPAPATASAPAPAAEPTSPGMCSLGARASAPLAITLLGLAAALASRRRARR